MDDFAGAPSSAAAAELAGRLRLLAVLLRYMETSSDAPAAAESVHPAMPLLQLANPALEAVAGCAALQADKKVYNALCDVRTHPLPMLLPRSLPAIAAPPLKCLIDACSRHNWL